MKQVLAAKSLLLRGINRTIKRLQFPLLAAVGKAIAVNKGINNLRIKKEVFTPPCKIDCQELKCYFS